MRSSKERITGLYVIKNTETGELYVGRSVDIFRRVSEHQSDIRNGRNTVGSNIPSIEAMKFCVHELPSTLSAFQIRFYEQHLLTQVKAQYGSGNVINKINAMQEDAYNQHKTVLGV